MIKRLCNIVIGPKFQRIRGFLGPVDRGKHDDIVTRVNLFDLSQRFNTIHFRHHNVQKNQVKPMGFDLCECFRTTLRAGDIILIFQNLFERIPDGFVIIDHQYLGRN